LRRYRLPFDGGSADHQTLLAGPIEFPIINYRQVSTCPYRYCYAVGQTDPPSTGLFDSLIEYDLDTESRTAWSEPGVYPSEPVFVARNRAPEPGEEATAEDDGVILSEMLDTRVDRSLLLVLDATSFAELARVTLPTVFPFGFHGQWYPDDELSHRTMP